MNNIDFKTFNFSVIGAECSLKGDVTLSGDSLIAGHIEGSVTLVKSGKLTIERDSKIEGNVYCEDLEVFGTIEGSIQSTGSVTIRSSAYISGKVEAKKLSIYPGAILNIEGHTPEDTL